MKQKSFISIAIYAMKFSIYQIIAITLLTCTAAAKDSDAQGLLDKRVSLKAEQQDFKSVIAQVEQLTDVKFVYSTKAIKSSK